MNAGDQNRTSAKAAEKTTDETGNPRRSRRNEVGRDQPPSISDRNWTRAAAVFKRSRSRSRSASLKGGQQQCMLVRSASYPGAAIASSYDFEFIDFSPVWVEDSKCVAQVRVLRNPTKSVTRPKPPRGNAEVPGRENRPRHSSTGPQSPRRPTSAVAARRSRQKSVLCKTGHFGVSGDRRRADAETAGAPAGNRVSPTYSALESPVGSQPLGRALTKPSHLDDGTVSKMFKHAARQVVKDPAMCGSLIASVLATSTATGQAAPPLPPANSLASRC
jgi:hypothetical protein